MATYLAIKSYTYKGKQTSYPTRKSLNKRMGNAFNLRSITEAIKQLGETGLIKRLYDAVTNIWFFKVKTESPVRSKQQRGGRRQPPHQKKHQNKHTENRITKEERTEQWVKDVYDTKERIAFWETSEWAKKQLLKGMRKPTFILPTKRPKWLSTNDIRAFLKKHHKGINEDTWLWKFWVLLPEPSKTL